ncbi:MAG: hypothetical protein CMQ25_11500 [Gammaproteobacteria bacterium]|nr:hypothetical protein [Gammaproteobacteria bacterium]
MSLHPKINVLIFWVIFVYKNLKNHQLQSQIELIIPGPLIMLSIFIELSNLNKSQSLWTGPIQFWGNYMALMRS